MNTNSNTYTVVYSTILVVLVAAILSLAAVGLKPMQDENIKVETISKILTAAHLYDAEKAANEGNSYAIDQYGSKIIAAQIINVDGVVIDSMKTQGADIEFKIALKDQYNTMKAINDAVKNGNTEKANELKAGLQLPVYIFDVEGKTVRIVPCYGAGLWGPIWGYIALDESLDTISGTVFDHKGETPGLGAEIAKPAFYEQFTGKKIYKNGKIELSIVKGGAKGDINGVDAISGGTITSQALASTMNTWLSFYDSYFKSNTPTQDMSVSYKLPN